MPFMLLHSSDPRAVPGRRIHVVGTSGCGKTTLARELARRFGLTHVELDAIHWQPNWVALETEKMRAAVAVAISSPTFVIDGNYSKVTDSFRPRIDTLLWLDYTFGLVMRQVVDRTIRRVIRRERLWNGNRESLRLTFSKDSILLWVVQTHARRRREMREMLAAGEYDHVRVIRFGSPSELKRWLGRLGRADGLPVACG